MATSGQDIEYSAEAAADLSTKYGYAMKLNSSGKLAICDTAGEPTCGPLRNQPTSGQIGRYTALGEAPVKLAGTTAVGDRLTPDANGKWAVTTSKSDATGAIAREAGSADEIKKAFIVGEQRSARQVWHVPVDLPSLANGVMWTWTPGFAGKIVKWEFVTTKVASTAAKAATLNLEIGGSNVTETLALTTGTCDSIGETTSTAVASGAFTAAQALALEAASVTAFVEGQGFLRIYVE